MMGFVFNEKKWNFMKPKQRYFVEYNGELLKFEGFDSLEEWVKGLKNGEDYTLYIVGSYAKMIKNEEKV
jgi:hypothetical protein